MKIILRVMAISGSLIFLLTFSAPGFAVDFFTDFEDVDDQTDPTTNTVVSDNGLNADFTGGTIDFLGIGALYSSGQKSWMVQPMGDMTNGSTGISSGTGVITFSQGAVCVNVFGRNENGVTVAEVRIKDTGGNLIESAIALNDSSFTEITKSRTMGQTLIGSVELILLSGTGTGMAALDDVFFSTDDLLCGQSSSSGGGSSDTTSNDEESDASSSSGSSGLNLFGIMLLTVMLITSRRYFSRCREFDIE